MLNACIIFVARMNIFYFNNNFLLFKFGKLFAPKLFVILIKPVYEHFPPLLSLTLSSQLLLLLEAV